MNGHRSEIAKALAVTAEVCGSQLSEMALAIMVDELDSYEFEAVTKALKIVMREHTGRLSLAVIIARIDDPNAPMGADQAWNVAITARIWEDEATLIIPAAIFQAFPLALWNTGDRVAARMAFKDAYPALAARLGDEVFVSLGWDVEGRMSAMDEAVRNKVITEGRAIRLLPERVITDMNMPDCPRCSGTGWERVTLPHPKGGAYQAVKECSCTRKGS